MKKSTNVKIKNVGATISCTHFEESTKEKNRGITLIALIITIIVMLILVAVSISIALNTGLFESAGKATKDWKTAQDEEAELGNGKVNIGGTVYDSIDEYIAGIGNVQETHNWTRNGDTVTCSYCETTLTIGEQLDYNETGDASATVNGDISGMSQALEDGIFYENEKINADGSQSINKDEEAKWVVLGIEDQNKNGINETLLITTLTPTEDTLHIYAESGYKNVIQITNEVCKKLYGNDARSMTMDDINNCFEYTPSGGTYEDENGIQTTEDFETKLEDLPIWAAIQENHSEGEYFTPEFPNGTTDTSKLGKYVIDGYSYMFSESGDETYTLENNNNEPIKTITKATKELIFGESADYTYWLASRGATATTSYVVFSPGSVTYSNAGMYCASFQSDNTYFKNFSPISVRGVISLTSEIPASLGIPTE